MVFAPYENGVTLDYNHNYTLISEHGGIGGDQMHPFLMYDPETLRLEPRRIDDSRDIHKVLADYLED